MMFEKRAQIPVEIRNYSIFYIVFSGFLFLGTIWAVWDEVITRRPWKDYQEQYGRLLGMKLDSLQHAALEGIDKDELTHLQDELQQAKQRLNSEEYQNATSKNNSLLADLEIATRESRFARSRSDAAYYLYKKSIHDGKEDQELKNAVDQYEAQIKLHAKEMAELNAQLAAVNQIIALYERPVDSLQSAVTKLLLESRSYATKAERARNHPIEVKQVILTDFELTPFEEIKARVDRCQTCHSGWNESLMAEASQPFTKHPLPELLEKHNPETFGCTPCHRGQGPALTAGYAHGDEDHYWDTPLLRSKDVYASCNSCHYNETSLKFAKPFTRAKQLIVDSGCYACHEIGGMTDLRKIGPQLNSLTAKVQPEWTYRWLKNPKEYNLHTRMPNFKLTDEEAEAITAYLVSVGKQSAYQPVRSKGSYAGGNASAGKLLFESVGCQACHTLGTVEKVREARGTSYDIAPELTRVGSKTHPDWIFDWIKNPRHFNPDTKMPSLRLTDDEARHLVAYLTMQKDTRILDPVKLDLDDPQKIARGEKYIRDYGCAGCHDIKGMENEAKVSVSLSDFGRKKVEQMDFGDTKELPKSSPEVYKEFDNGTVSVKQTWEGWVYGKLKNARLYQTDRIVQRMPVFTFNDEEIRLIRMFLKGLRNDMPVAKYRQPFDKRHQDIEAGRRLTMQYNCIQCHTMDDRGGYVLTNYEEQALGPPLLPESQGAKVQEQWLHGFLKNPSTIRPWLKIRMPTFSLTDAEISKIQKYFLGLSKQELVIRDYASTPVDPRYLGPGKALFQTYQCAKCHPTGAVQIGSGLTASDLALDLSKASSRLKPEWILDWLHDPQKLQPGTRMPAYFYGGQAPDPTVLGGSADEQIRALKTYVWSLGKRGSSVALVQ